MGENIPIDFVCYRRFGNERLEDLRDPWTALYRHQRDHGMLLQVPENAFDAWISSVQPFLGRFAEIIVAEQNQHVLGFVTCRIRTLPPYFGSKTVGFISEVFVDEAYRSKGIGGCMLDEAKKWFSEQQIDRIELHVVAGNEQGLRFYDRLGWRRELLQMVWQKKESV